MIEHRIMKITDLNRHKLNIFDDKINQHMENSSVPINREKDASLNLITANHNLKKRLETDEEKVKCRICFSRRSERDNDYLFSPCLCTGSIKSIHQYCLKKWILAQGDFNGTKQINCELCKYEFKMKYEFKKKFYCMNVKYFLREMLSVCVILVGFCLVLSIILNMIMIR